MAETVKIQAYVTATPDASQFVQANSKREWDAYPVIKGNVTAAPDASKFVQGSTRREWDSYPLIKGYVTAEPNADAYSTGNTLRVVGGRINEITQTYKFEMLQGATATYKFEPLTKSVDIDNTYMLQIIVNEPPKPPKEPNIQEPLFINGRYGEEMNPYFTPGDIGHTLLLNDSWDIFSDASGQIALTSGTYAVAQNAANAVRLFTKDAYLAQTKGIPHFDIELGKSPAIAAPILRTRIRDTVLAIDGITDAGVELNFDEGGRILGGKILGTVLESENIEIDI